MLTLANGSLCELVSVNNSLSHCKRMAAYKNSKVTKKSHSTHTVFSTADPNVKVSSSTSSDDSNFDEVAAAMASFSIEGLLGLGKDNDKKNNSGKGAGKNKKKKSGEGSSAEQAASEDENGSTSKDAATATNGKPTPQQQDKDVNGEPSGLGAAANDSTDEATKETLHESEHEENDTELVTVEVRTMHTSRSIRSRSSSRKRKRTTGEPSHTDMKEQQREPTPESDGKLVIINFV